MMANNVSTIIEVWLSKCESILNSFFQGFYVRLKSILQGIELWFSCCFFICTSQYSICADFQFIWYSEYAGLNFKPHKKCLFSECFGNKPNDISIDCFVHFVVIHRIYILVCRANGFPEMEPKSHWLVQSLNSWKYVAIGTFGKAISSRQMHSSYGFIPRLTHLLNIFCNCGKKMEIVKRKNTFTYFLRFNKFFNLFLVRWAKTKSFSDDRILSRFLISEVSLVPKKL